MNPLIAFNSVDMAYGNKNVFHDLNCEIHRGDFLGIVGPNGSGKTTFLRGILGLSVPRQGRILRAPNVRFGYCKQRQSIDTIFPFTVFDVVMMARTKMIGRLRKPSPKDRDEVFQALRLTGIADLAREHFFSLSGGQKQRVILARALALNPDFLVLDEPTADLDIKAEREILELVKTLYDQRNLTVALVTHELNEVLNTAKSFLFLTAPAPRRLIMKEDLSEQFLSEIFNTRIRLRTIDGKLMVM